MKGQNDALLIQLVSDTARISERVDAVSERFVAHMNAEEARDTLMEKRLRTMEKVSWVLFGEVAAVLIKVLLFG